MVSQPALAYRLVGAPASRMLAFSIAAVLLLPARAVAPHGSPSGQPLAGPSSGPPAGPLPPVQAPASDDLSESREAGSELTVSLVTIGVGQQAWERFGHNAIRIRDEIRGTDIAYNWGVFSFQQEGFFLRFLQGDWQYWMEAFQGQPMIQAYEAQNRSVVEQQLDLTPAERVELRDFVELNRRPENRFYRYQYFLDNCSTRVRDVLDRVVRGRLGATSAVVSGATYRFHTRRLTQIDPLIYVMLDFFLGGRGDRPITDWDEMFIPMLLRDHIRNVEAEGPGSESRPVVRSERVLFQAVDEDEPAKPTSFFWVFAATGVLMAGLVAGLAMLAPHEGVPGWVGKLGFLAVGGLWSFVAGVAGTIMIVSHLTDHEFMYWNENFLQANPVSLALLALLPAAVLRRKEHPLASRLSVLVAAAAALGFLLQALPALDQVNGYYVVVALPMHLAVAWGLGVLGGTDELA